MSVRKIDLRAPVLVVPQELVMSGDRSLSMRAERALIVLPSGSTPADIQAIVDGIPWASVPVEGGDA